MIVLHGIISLLKQSRSLIRSTSRVFKIYQENRLIMCPYFVKNTAIIRHIIDPFNLRIAVSYSDIISIITLPIVKFH